MISIAEILKNRDKEFPLTPKMQKNLEQLYIAVNKIRSYYGKPMVVTSGYRPPYYNKLAKGAPKSAHLTCEACDFADPDGELAKWCLENLDKLEEAGLWMEDPKFTPQWLHLQIRPVKGKRVFTP